MVVKISFDFEGWNARLERTQLNDPMFGADHIYGGEFKVTDVQSRNHILREKQSLYS